MQSLSDFIDSHLGGSYWSPWTGNQQAGIKPQCYDLAALWAESLGLSRFPRTGNADDLLGTASDWDWEKHNGAETPIPPGALIIYRTHSQNGHVAICRRISHADMQYTLDQNWSKPNHVTLETHRDLYVLGWMRGEWLAMATRREVQELLDERLAYAIGAIQKGGNSQFSDKTVPAIPGSPSLQVVARRIDEIRADVAEIKAKMDA